MQKSAEAFRTISEVAEDLALPQHVLRFWETRFTQIRPLKRAGGRRYYRPADVLLLKTIRQLLYDDGYTIKGVQRLIKEQGTKGLGGALPSVDFDAVDLGPDDLPSGDLAAVPDDVPAFAEQPESAERQALPNEIAPAPAAEEGAPAGLHRDAIADAIATLDECKRILDAVRPPA